MKQVASDGKTTDAKGKARPKGSFYKCIKALSPIPFLTRARDFYVRKITQCAGNSSYVGIAGAPGATMTLPKSFSSSSAYRREGDDDYSELVRAASQRERPTPIKITKLMDHQPFPRSFSASTATDHHNRNLQLDVERIDEDSPCYFSGSFRKSVDEDLRFPRSRSCSTVQTLKPHERKNIAV
uniref:Uncharacterized protein n=1 Tax=Picea sitchensis TaxID=3332 RepID=A9NZB0_PICSI|nr:unknown [Picea sitchensis]